MTKRGVNVISLIIGVAIFAAVTFRFPDLDIKLLGIGKHRYFLFHSAIVPLLLWRFSRSLQQIAVIGFILTIFIGGFLVGVGVHLVTDVFQTAPVKFPFIGSLVDGTSIDDRLWEGINAIICFVTAWKIGRRRVEQRADSSDFNI